MPPGDAVSENTQRHLPYVIRPHGPRTPPGTKFTYPIYAKNKSVADDWTALCATYENAARRCYDHLALTPNERPQNPARGHALRGVLGRRGLHQYEVGGGARVWYVVEDVDHIVVIREVHISHPKATE